MGQGKGREKCLDSGYNVKMKLTGLVIDHRWGKRERENLPKMNPSFERPLQLRG